MHCILCPRHWLGVFLLLAAAALPAHAQGLNCETLRESIAAKYRAGGVAQPRLLIVAGQDRAPGKVVGTCAQGSHRIVYLPDRPGADEPRAAAAAPPARKADDAILTECRDGSVSVGGNCGRR